MQRRRALAALSGAAAWRPIAARSQALAAAGVLAWGERGLWVARVGDDRPIALTEGALGPVAPRPHAGGAVAVDAHGQLSAWRAEPGGSWQPAWTLELDAAVHALAASDDGRWTLAAHGRALSLIDAGGRVQRRYAGEDATRRVQGSAASLQHHAGRRSFVVAWPTLGELWEIQLDASAPPVFEGLVHDYRMGEAIATPGQFAVRRSPLGPAVPSLAFCDARVAWVAGMVARQLAVVHLDVRRRIAAWPLPEARPAGAALVGAAASWQWWLPVGDTVQVIDASGWQVAAQHRLPGRVHAVFVVQGAPWAWLGQAVPLHAWRRGAWQAVDGVPTALSAASVDTTGGGLWCASATAGEILRLDGEGRPVQRWTLSADAALQGLAALPG